MELLVLGVNSGGFYGAILELYKYRDVALVVEQHIWLQDE